MRRPMVITLGELRVLRACDEGLKDFANAFEASAEVTRENLMAMREHVWWIVLMLPRMRRFTRRYEEAKKPHVKRYNMAVEKHFKAFRVEQDRAWDAYEMAGAKAGFDGVPPRVARAEARLREAMRPHEDRLDRAMANCLADAMGLPKGKRGKRCQRKESR